MTLLRHRGRAFADFAAAPSELEARLAELLRHRTGRRPSPAEAHSWSGSLPILAQDILDAGLDNIEVLVEHQLPLTSKRVDVILAGRHPRTGAPSYVVVELKQWSQATLYDRPVNSSRSRVRPADRDSIRSPRSSATAITSWISPQPCMTKPTRSPARPICTTQAPISNRASAATRSPSRGRLFTGAESREVHRIPSVPAGPGVSGAPYADRLLRSAAAPSRQLLTVVAEELAAREQFVLLDEQAVAFDLVMHAVEEARASDQKTAVIISGGPGSGKSVIALSLMGALAARGRTVVHATGSRAFTQTLRDVSGFRKARAGTVFKYFNSFMEAERNGLGCPDSRRSAPDPRDLGEPVHPGGPADRAAAGRRTAGHRPGAGLPARSAPGREAGRDGNRGGHRAPCQRPPGLKVHHVSLDAQFRCGGSEAYIDWVQRLLGLAGDGPVAWDPDERFALDVVETPSELESRLAAYRDAGFGARMTAGFCWPWSDPKADGTLVPDVEIGSWSSRGT